ncbi:methyltransferase-like protein 25 [Zootermopsis nevadensis]|uniref:methyltransferase-like protein 25 n=1 Tax=Zootermopsis nevadensis TaxID=136037 RepID=UPI000B8EAD8B|nr:methyltransferase-like protein 25 [Zootermopsis nevadensis]
MMIVAIFDKMQAEIVSRLEEIIKYLKPLLPLANCHMVNFITNEMWEIYVPDGIKKEVSSVELEVLNKVFMHHAKGISVCEQKSELMERIPNFINYLDSAKDVLKEKWKDSIWVTIEVLKLIIAIFDKMQAEIVSRLEEIIKYLKPLLPLANCHMVNFITNEMWEIYVPDGIKKEVSSVELEVLNKVFMHHAKGISVCEQKSELMERIPNFINYLDSARNMGLHGISVQGIVTSMSDLQKKLVELGCECQESLHMEQFMTPKKMHEVEAMSQLVSALARVSQASHVVDVGGGKGYLSSILAFHYGFRVLGVDSSQVNTHGAVKRTQKLEKMPNVLCHRANIFKQGNSQPWRGKHRKSQISTKILEGRGCNSAESATDINPLPSESLFFRALLQVLVFNKFGNDIPWGQVGRLKYHNFADYVQKAVKKLHLNIDVSTDEIESLYKEHSVDQQLLHVFFIMRVALAPVIEAVILLDRLLYLHEQLHVDDGLPAQVCQQCVHKVNTYYNFRLQCESSDFKLRQYLSTELSKNQLCSVSAAVKEESGQIHALAKEGTSVPIGHEAG